VKKINSTRGYIYRKARYIIEDMDANDAFEQILEKLVESRSNLGT